MSTEDNNVEVISGASRPRLLSKELIYILFPEDEWVALKEFRVRSFFKQMYSQKLIRRKRTREQRQSFYGTFP